MSNPHGSIPDRNDALSSSSSHSRISSSSRPSQLDHDDPNNLCDVVHAFGDTQLLQQINWSRNDQVRSDRVTITISTFNGDDDSLSDGSGNSYEHMHISTRRRTQALGDRLLQRARRICRRMVTLEQTRPPQKTKERTTEAVTMIENIPIHHVDCLHPDTVYVMGRIVVLNDQQNDRLALIDHYSVTVRQRPLDMSRMVHWSLFPGEIVVLEGVNRCDKFQVHNIYFKEELVSSRAPTNLTSDLSLVMAAGPYTAKDDLQYEKLSGLLAYCKTNCPDVLILTGPFGDMTNPLFNTIMETYEEFFERMVIDIMSSVSTNTEVLIVSHHDDLVSMFVYPTLPYGIVSANFPNLSFLPDPCVITINGLEIGITTADIINDLSEAEESSDPMGDKIQRAFNYMFHHRTFYPLFPPAENLALDVNSLATVGNLPRVPNMMICPGNLESYIKEVHRCVCINPGHLSDQTTGQGTFARVVIKRPEAETEESPKYVACQVVKS